MQLTLQDMQMQLCCYETHKCQGSHVTIFTVNLDEHNCHLTLHTQCRFVTLVGLCKHAAKRQTAARCAWGAGCSLDIASAMTKDHNTNLATQ